MESGIIGNDTSFQSYEFIDYLVNNDLHKIKKVRKNS